MERYAYVSVALQKFTGVVSVGRNVQRYVPLEYLPNEDAIEYICEAYYRWVTFGLKPYV